MAIIRFGDRPFFGFPWTEVERMRRDMDALLSGFDLESAPHRAARVYPVLNISEDKDNIYVRAETPGVAADTFDIAVEGDTLLIKGERKACSKDGKVSYHRREIECGRFSRAVTLPTSVKAEKVKAAAAAGILTITLPKAEEVKPRQIAVKVG